jgi:RNA polymerase sigma-70 factor (ECF subfamily)
VDAAQLFEAHGPAIYRRCRALLGDDDAAHDAVQEVFMRTISRAETFRGDSPPLLWLYAIATTHCLQQLRNERRRLRKIAEISPEQSATSGIDDRLLWEVILDLADPETRRIALLRHVDGHTLEEVAELVGLSRKTVAKKLDLFARQAKDVLAAGSSS